MVVESSKNVTGKENNVSLSNVGKGEQWSLKRFCVRAYLPSRRRMVNFFVQGFEAVDVCIVILTLK